MGKELFIVCPFSKLEAFLQARFGEDALFLSFPAASILQAQDFDSVIDYLITEEGIRTIYAVNDADCEFIKGITEKKGVKGMPHEKALEDLYIEHYFSCFKDRPSAEQRLKLAELNVNEQVNKVAYFLSRPRYSIATCIEVKGLVTSKKNKTIEEVKINRPAGSAQKCNCFSLKV